MSEQSQNTQVVLYSGGLIYLVNSLIFLIIFTLNRCPNSFCSRQHEGTVFSGRSNPKSGKSDGTRQIPITFLVPSSTSSVITQGTLEKLMPNLVSDCNSLGTAIRVDPASKNVTASPSPPLLPPPPPSPPPPPLATQIAFKTNKMVPKRQKVSDSPMDKNAKKTIGRSTKR